MRTKWIQKTLSVLMIALLSLSFFCRLPVRAQDDANSAQEENLPQEIHEDTSDNENSDSHEIIPDSEEEQEYPDPEPVSVTSAPVDADNPDSESLYSEYLMNIMMENPDASAGPVLRSAVNPASGLTGIEAAWFPLMVQFVKQVAAGNRTSTEQLVSTGDLGFSKTLFTASELGLSYIYKDGVWNSGLSDAIKKKFIGDYTKAMGAVSYKYPYETYWLKSYGYHYYYNAKYNSSTGQYELYFVDDAISFYYYVGAEYQLSGDNLQFNTANVSRAKQAAANARAVVSQYSSLGDWDKLEAYKDKICALTEYDDYAADVLPDNTEISDPWNLIYVFDNDTSTNVVCAGYANAFQYLCDLSTFSSDISVITVNGPMGSDPNDMGSHRWNIVRYSDNRNYLVDCTNCDSGTSGYPNYLFMATPVRGSVSGGYVFSVRNGRELTFKYSDKTLALYSQETLAVGSTVSAPTLNSMTNNRYTYDGGTAKFSIDASGTWLTYQWEYDSGSGWTSWPYADAATDTITFTAKLNMHGWLFRCKVTDANGKTSTSNGFPLSVIGFTKKPTNQGASNGAKISFSAVGQGDGLTYQWQTYDSASSDWVSCSTSIFTGCTGSTTPNLSFTMKKEYDGRWIRCKIYDSHGASYWCASVKAILAPDAPVISSVENNVKGVKISWNKVTGASKYVIYRKGPGESGFSVLASTTALSYVNQNPVSGKEYRYSVRAMHADGSTLSSFSVGKSILYMKAPVITVENTESGIKISWGTVAGASKYVIYRKGPGESGFSKLTSTTALNYTNTGVTNNKEYRYSVRSVSSDGKTLSAFSAGQSVLRLIKPVLTGAENTTSGVRISWAKRTGASKYRVLRKTGSGSWVKLAETSSLNYTDKTAASGTSYSYTVRAISSDGASLSTIANSVSVKYIAAPVISTAVKVTGGIKVSWGKVTGASKYTVLRKGPGETGFSAVATVTSLSYTDTKVKSSSEYRYAIRAAAADGTISAISAGMSAKY